MGLLNNTRFFEPFLFAIVIVIAYLFIYLFVFFFLQPNQWPRVRVCIHDIVRREIRYSRRNPQTLCVCVCVFVLGYVCLIHLRRRPRTLRLDRFQDRTRFFSRRIRVYARDRC